MTGVLVTKKAYSDTRARMEGVSDALTMFVSRTLRLPCPADGTQGTGLEERDSITGVCKAQQLGGVVPWATLGIPEADATDGWNTRLTYRVALGQTSNATPLNFTACDTFGQKPALGAAPTQSCDPAGTSIATCTAFSLVLNGKGIEVRKLDTSIIAAPSLSTGAAYVLISHGENHALGYSGTGVLQAGVAGLNETNTNAGNLALQPYYYADTFTTQSPSLYFDDLVTYRSVQSQATAAGLSARPH